MEFTPALLRMNDGAAVTDGEDWTDEYSLIDSGLRGFIFKIQRKISYGNNENQTAARS